MAWIVSFEKKEGTSRRQPTDVTAAVKIFDAANGSPILQIYTGGSADRENPGKQSQTLQIGREAAAQLYKILQETYGFGK